MFATWFECIAVQNALVIWWLQRWLFDAEHDWAVGWTDRKKSAREKAVHTVAEKHQAERVLAAKAERVFCAVAEVGIRSEE